VIKPSVKSEESFTEKNKKNQQIKNASILFEDDNEKVLRNIVIKPNVKELNSRIKLNNNLFKKIKSLFSKRNWREIIELITDNPDLKNDELINEYLINSYYESVDEYIEANKYNTAIIFLEQAIYTEHKIYRLLKIKLAEVYHLYGKTWKGVWVLKDLLETSTDTIEEMNIEKLKIRYINEQEAFLRNNKHWTNLIEFYKKLSYENNLNFITQMKLAETYLKLDNVEEGENIINIVLRKYPNSVEAISLKEKIEKYPQKSVIEVQGEIPVEFIGNSIYIDVMFNGKHKVKMLLDTGASMVHISPKLLRIMKIEPSEKINVRRFITASGRIALPIYKVKSITIEEFKVTDIEVASMVTELQNDAQGILGMSYLKNYIFSIDTSKSVLLLKTK